ncbi:MAG: glycosyltransferase family 2 protein, partial [Oscillospiraceae bacterium]
MDIHKKVAVVIPCYNEEKNALAIYEAIKAEFLKNLPQYDWDLLFIDNKSNDKTREIITQICDNDKHVKAIFNMKNFGQFNSPYYAITQTNSDCTILMAADFQDPVEMIPQLVAEWENGNKVVCAIKTTSKENGIMYFLRSCYYKLIKKMSDVEQIEHFTGFGLYDKSFVDVLRELKDPTPFLRGIVAEYAPNHKEIPYEQACRRAGKTHNNWYSLYDAAMLSFTSYTKIGLRMATIAGFIISGISFLIALVYLVMKLVYWDRFIAGTTPLLIGVFFMGGIQLFFIGLIGEYILNMNTRIINRPLVIEEKRLNFDDKQINTD